MQQLESILAHRLDSTSHALAPSSETFSNTPAPAFDLSLLSDLCAASPAAPTGPLANGPLPSRPSANAADAFTDPSLLKEFSQQHAYERHARSNARPAPANTTLLQLSSTLRRAALDQTCWRDSATDADEASESGTWPVRAAFLARLLVLFPRRHIADALVDAFLSLPNRIYLNALDPAQLKKAMDGLYRDLLDGKRPSVAPAFIALLLAVFAAGLLAADPAIPSQRAALHACGWLPHPNQAVQGEDGGAGSDLHQSFFNVRVAGLTGFPTGDGPGGQVRLTIPFTVKAWHESCLKALHLADFLARPSFTALAALQVMGCVCLEPPQAARRDSLAAVGFVLAKRLRLDRPAPQESASQAAQPSDNATDHVASIRTRQNSRLMCGMVLQDFQMALAQPDRGSFFAWPRSIEARMQQFANDSASETYDKLMARCLSLSHQLWRTLLHQGLDAQADHIPFSLATELCRQIDQYQFGLPPEYLLTEADLAFPAHLWPASAQSRRNTLSVISPTTTTHGAATANRDTNVATQVELDRRMLHLHLCSLRVFVLSRVNTVGHDPMEGALRSELHTAALRCLSLAANLSTVWPAFNKFGNNGLVLVSSALSLALHLQLGLVQDSIRADVVHALHWTADQLEILRGQGAQIGRVRWLLNEVLRLCHPTDASRLSRTFRKSAGAHEQLRHLCSQLVASSNTLDHEGLPARSHNPAWSHFVGPEPLDSPGSVTHFSTKHGQPLTEDHNENAFHVLRVEPDSTVVLHRSEPNPPTSAPSNAPAFQRFEPNQHASMHASSSSTSTSTADANAPLSMEQQRLFSFADTALPTTSSNFHMGAEMPSHNSTAPIDFQQALQPPSVDGQAAEEPPVPQWVSSLLEAVLNGVA